MSGKNKGSAPAADRFRELADGWERMMVQIWKDRMALAGALHTGALHRSVAGDAPVVRDLSAAFTFRHLHYGVYVEGGVGPEFSRSRRAADGTLPLLDESYRAEHGLDRPRRRGPAWGGGMTSGRPRKARPWFGMSWAISRRVLAERTQQLVGDEFIGLFDEMSE